MKKFIILTLTIITSFTLSGCSNTTTYKVGATLVPHAEILKHVQPLLEEQGYTFEIVEFNDYVLPNSSLDSGDIIANYFQHTPYLNAQIDEYGYDFVNVGGVHVEPIGLYTKQYDSIDELPDEINIIISNSPSDRPRLLGVLEENNLITLNDSTTSEDITNSTVDALASLFTSSKTITFTEVSPELLYTNYNNKEGDVVLINGNFALDNGLNPLTDSIALEGSASLYVNIVVTTEENEQNPFIQALVATLQSETVQQWIIDTYEGAVIPISN